MDGLKLPFDVWMNFDPEYEVNLRYLRFLSDLRLTTAIGHIISKIMTPRSPIAISKFHSNFIFTILLQLYIKTAKVLWFMKWPQTGIASLHFKTILCNKLNLLYIYIYIYIITLAKRGYCIGRVLWILVFMWSDAVTYCISYLQLVVVGQSRCYGAHPNRFLPY